MPVEFPAVQLPSVTAWLCCGVTLPDSRLQMGPLLKSQFWLRACSAATVLSSVPERKCLEKWKRWDELKRNCCPRGKCIFARAEWKSKIKYTERAKRTEDTYSKVIQLRMIVCSPPMILHHGCRCLEFHDVQYTVYSGLDLCFRLKVSICQALWVRFWPFFF